MPIISCSHAFSIFPAGKTYPIKMLTGFILTASVLAQFATAYMALKLIQVTGNRLAWSLISFAISFMAVRRGISLFQYVSGEYLTPMDMSFELVGLLTSILMFAGVILISPLFRSMAEEIVQRRQAEEALNKTGRELSNITSNLTEGVYVLNDYGHIVFMNPEAERLLGWTMDELNERGTHDLVHFRRADGTPLPFEECNMHKVIASNERFSSTDEVFVRKDGTVFPISVISGPIMEDGKVVASVTVFQDITELKRIDGQLRKSLAEKEILLREVHHRVKNNMFVIISLLSLQSGSLSDPRAIEVLRECQNRIRTMLIIYEKLYRSPDLSKVDFDEYIRDLTTSLFETYSVHPGKITLDLDIAGVSIDIEKAMPCGLIINELLSNSIKYGFPEDSSGKITVSIQPAGANEIELVVGDNGVGMPEDTDMTKAKTFGLQLVNILVDQLDGKLQLNYEKGTEFRILFKVEQD